MPLIQYCHTNLYSEHHDSQPLGIRLPHPDAHVDTTTHEHLRETHHHYCLTVALQDLNGRAVTLVQSTDGAIYGGREYAVGANA